MTSATDFGAGKAHTRGWEATVGGYSWEATVSSATDFGAGEARTRGWEATVGGYSQFLKRFNIIVRTCFTPLCFHLRGGPFSVNYTSWAVFAFFYLLLHRTATVPTPYCGALRATSNQLHEP